MIRDFRPAVVASFIAVLCDTVAECSPLGTIES